jgi:NADPH-dependent 2,4-dienoyl-CoA reductase/sulfur reductase-like enzyme
MIGIIDWRMAQCAARDVTFHFNTWADADDITLLAPDVVIVAAGGLPQLRLYEQMEDLPHVISAWDILSGDVKASGDVLIFDEAGDHAGLQAAEIAASSASVEVMTPDRSFAPEVMGLNLVPYITTLQDKDVQMTVARRLMGVRKEGNRLMAELGSDYSAKRVEKPYDQIVVNYGTLPNADLYFDLKPLSSNLGEVDHEALIDGHKQALIANSEGGFQLFRIGDAVAARNTHAAIYDALRLMKNL